MKKEGLRKAGLMHRVFSMIDARQALNLAAGVLTGDRSGWNEENPRRQLDLTAGEVAAKANRHGHRDATMILIAFRHQLRAAELCDRAAVLHVRRAKNGTPSTHPPRREARPCNFGRGAPEPNRPTR
jgi:hypothetical protein